MTDDDHFQESDYQLIQRLLTYRTEEELRQLIDELQPADGAEIAELEKSFQEAYETIKIWEERYKLKENKNLTFKWHYKTDAKQDNIAALLAKDLKTILRLAGHKIPKGANENQKAEAILTTLAEAGQAWEKKDISKFNKAKENQDHTIEELKKMLAVLRK